LGLIAVWLMH